MLDFTLTVNSTDLTSYILYDSYSTAKVPVYSDSVMTVDGVTHIKKLRDVGRITFKLNPQNTTTTQTIASALLQQPCAVHYFSLQSGIYENVTMKLNEQSAEYLVRCKFLGEKWTQPAQITLEEL